MPLRKIATFCPMLLLTALAACGTEGADASPSFTVRDSAGIQIVESTAPMWNDGDAWTLAAEPAVDIGVVQGAPEYQLSEVIGAQLLPDGRLAVANGGSREIRFYDGAGAYIGASGGKGGGPGEFQDLAWIEILPDDSLLAFDGVQQRLSVFSPGGDFVRSVRLAPLPEGGPALAIGAFQDGSMVVATTRIDRNSLEGLQRWPNIFLHYSDEGRMLDTISVQPGTQTYIRTHMTDGKITGASFDQPLFGRTQMATMNGDRAVFGGNDEYELGVYAPDGALETLIRRDLDARPVTDAAAEASIQQTLAAVQNPARREDEEHSLRTMPRPATMPSYEAVLLDDGGDLWVQNYQPVPVADAPSGWTVFDDEGAMLGDVSMPARFKPMEIGDDFVLGVWKDDLDVEHVRMYALEKPI